MEPALIKCTSTGGNAVYINATLHPLSMVADAQ